MAARMMIQSRHIQQAMIKNPRTKWLRNFKWDEPVQTTMEEKSAALVESTTRPERAHVFWVGWGSEFQKAWRAQYGLGIKEYACRIECDGCALDPVVAVWPDGWTHPIVDITIMDYQQNGQLIPCGQQKEKGHEQKDQKKRKRNSESSKLWTGTHIATKNAVIVTRKKDRAVLPLLVILEKGEAEAAGEVKQLLKF